MLPEVMVKQLVVYQENARGTYRGIRKEFFPKWCGWLLLEEGASAQELDRAVEEFYLSYFYYQMKLDQFDNQIIAFLLLDFATQHGKKKAISKLNQVANSIDSFNSLGVIGEYKLILEILEFLSYTSNSNTSWVLVAYHNL